MSRYISHFPKPLLNDLVRGQWLPMVGAGFSRNAVVTDGRATPLWSDFVDTFGTELQDYSPSSPVDAVSAYEHDFGRAALIERMSELLLIHDARPGASHKAFCTIPFDLVTTTNLDFLLERGYEEIGRHYTPLIDQDQLSVNLRDTELSLFKLHGDLHHPTRMVVTEQDYDRFLDSYPLIATFLANLVITRTLVLVGYSLDDPDFRQIWQIVADRLGGSRRRAYAISVGATPTEVSRFERRGVRVINLPGDPSDYSDVLTVALTEIGDYWRDNVIPASQVKEELSLAELALPPGASSRLCFFAVPLSTLSLYKERIFPIARDHGFVPVAADDIVSPGHTIQAKIAALIQRSHLVVVDASSLNTVFELRMARAKMDNSQILVVIPPAGGLPMYIEKIRSISRGEATHFDENDFIRGIRQWFTERAERSLSYVEKEPERLLEKKENRAAVIAAISLLEVYLRGRLDIPGGISGRRAGFGTLLEIGQRQGALDEERCKEIRGWLQVRNEVVHGLRDVGESEANSIVNGVLQTVRE